jgi:23S rRNA (guanosine2251-2'-O)-methyltransferase
MKPNRSKHFGVRNFEHRKKHFKPFRKNADEPARDYKEFGLPSAPSPELPQQNSEYVYGRRPVFEVFSAGKRSVHKLWVMEGINGGVIDDVLRLATEQGVAIDRVHRARLDNMVRGNHQGLIAQVSATKFGDLHEFLREEKDAKSLFLVALDELQDPQNIGSILRSAGFFGVDAVLLPRWRSAPVSEAAARASAGALEHLTLLRVKNMAETVLDLQKEGFQVWGADMAGKPLAELSPSPRQALILGNEGEGIRRLVKERCDTLVKIPGAGKVDSLNVGSAAAILIYTMKTKASGTSAR